jgi:dTDP-4-amino-4,6-dideoxygalactose transaminase
MQKINLYKPFLAHNAHEYVKDVLNSGLLSSGGKYTLACKNWFSEFYQSELVYFTHTCTDALEMSALLCHLKPGDEVILPSYTFVSTANAFALRGCTLKFVDSLAINPNIGIETILPHVSGNTKVIVVMHYAGIAVDMDPILSFARQHNILVIEDAAQAIGAKYNGKYLGTVSDLAGISFHDTKVISSGEGGCCIVNQAELNAKAEIIFEKGTNRLAFQRHEVSRYEWMEMGSSFGMSELQAAVLYSQLEEFNNQIQHRQKIWRLYMSLLKELENNEKLSLPVVPEYAEINGTHFYILLKDKETRSQLQNYLDEHGVESSFHYLALHRSPFYHNAYHQQLLNADRYESCLLRLPIHSEIGEVNVLNICGIIYGYFKKEH